MPLRILEASYEERLSKESESRASILRKGRVDIPSWVGGVAKLCYVADAAMDGFESPVCFVDKHIRIDDSVRGLKRTCDQRRQPHPGNRFNILQLAPSSSTDIYLRIYTSIIISHQHPPPPPLYDHPTAAPLASSHR
ncbi:hypothetical protein O988_09804 [Pseudogymnoascus sp. VKM F-3808]|nr:hypothetical protein O988_09804 [Pseudogymnoascus sp. VKM F-3808]